LCLNSGTHLTRRMTAIPGSPVPAKKPPTRESFQFGPWNISTIKSHILTSEDESVLSSQLSLPHFPDMLFLHNKVTLTHESGPSIEYNPLDALKRVNDHEDLVTVSYAESWLASRQDNPHLNNINHPYDWTFTTDYKGTLSEQWTAEESELNIDYEKLKIQEKILFFDEVILYEDELDDNGVAKLSVKLRVMPSGFFVLLRFYLRVDKTLIRVHDTRLRFEIENDFILREYSEREQKVNDLTVGREVWTDQNAIVDHLPVSTRKVEKLSFPV